MRGNRWKVGVYVVEDFNWNRKRVVVTGGCGFVGRHLVPMLVMMGTDVTIISRNLPAHFCPSITWEHYDVGDVDMCAHAFDGADVVFNLAAVMGGQKSMMYTQAAHFYDNVRVQVAPVIAAAQACVPIFVQVSSVSAYSTEQSTYASEDHAYDGEAAYGYGRAKRDGEWAVRQVFDGENGRGVIVRPTNMYGEYENFGTGAHVIPFLIRKFWESDGKPVVLYGDGAATRDMLHAEDGATGLIAAAEHGRNGRLYNLGTSGAQTVTIKYLAETIRDLMGSTSPIEWTDKTPVLDVHRCTMAERAENELDWRYRIPIDEGLKRTIEWFKTSADRRGIDD